ncbi:MAG: GNAT family N-acetyltransferase [Oscillospiraceae bacterium]|jgi:RimJ/RimL family protein N-acetyltransferase|nr:GNAT family N-acetyltransferase [Oscillospiraceae bacterium]
MWDLHLENGYDIRVLGQDHREAVARLSESCRDYFLLHFGRPPIPSDIDGIYEDLPPGKGYEDKFLLGVFAEEGRLAGLVELIRDYKEAGSWALGMMLLGPAERGRGLGRAIHSTLAKKTRTLGADRLRIVVAHDNLKGQAFWKAMGYEKTEHKCMMIGGKNHEVDIMRLPLTVESE